MPERLVGNARRQSQVQQTIILCIDQSGPMAESVVYSAVFGAVLASLRSVKTHLVVFDSDIVDLTDEIDDPSTCCSASSWVVAPTSTGRWRTARG